MSDGLLDPRIKLRHVGAFVEVARLRSVTGAAEVLGMTQPAVSKMLKELETILGVPLFDRSGRRLVLTEFGEVFLTHSGLAIAALRQGVDALSQARAGGAMIAVGALPTVSSGLVPRAIERFRRTPMFCRIRIVTGPSSYLFARLRVGEVDFVAGRMGSPEAMTGFSFEQLYSERILVVARPGHPLFSARTFHLRLIESYPVLMPPSGAIIRPPVERFLLAHGVGKLRDEVETFSNSLGRTLALETDAIWMISEAVVADDLAAGRLAALPVDTAETIGPIGITTRTGAALPPQAEALIRAIRQVAEAR